MTGLISRDEYEKVFMEVLEYTREHLSAVEHSCVEHLVDVPYDFLCTRGRELVSTANMSAENVYIGLANDIVVSVWDWIEPVHADNIVGIIKRANRRFFVRTGNIRYRLYGEML